MWLLQGLTLLAGYSLMQIIHIYCLFTPAY
jgi:hypothetical protein